MLYKYLQYLTVFCFSVTLSAQTNSTAEEIEKTIDTAYFSHAQGDFLKSIKFAKQAIAESKLNNYNQGIAWGNFFLAQSFLEVGNYEQTLHYLRKAEKNVHTQKDNYLKYEIHRVRGRSFSNMSLLQEAIKEHKKCLELIPKIDKNNEDKQFLTSLSYENISIVYKNLNQIDSSFQYLKKNKEVLESLEEASIPINLINLYSSLGDYYSLQNNFKISEQYFQKSLDLAEKYDYANIAYHLLLWGNMELRKKQYEKAIEFFTLALQNSTNRIGEKAEIYKSMSEAYQKMENLDLANKYKLLSLEIENEIRNSQLKSNEAILELMVENKTSKQNLYFRNRLILILIGGIILVILIYFLFRTKFNKSIKSLQKRIDEKHQEIETLEQKHLKDHTELLELAQTGNRDFWIQFQIVYPQFKERLIEINPKLTNSELTLAAYIVLGFNTREIADVTFRAYKTVETTRYNLRKKLNLSAETRVDEYLKEVLK